MQHVHGDQSPRRSLLDRLVEAADIYGLEIRISDRKVRLGGAGVPLPETEADLAELLESIHAASESAQLAIEVVRWKTAGELEYDASGRHISEKSG